MSGIPESTPVVEDSASSSKSASIGTGHPIGSEIQQTQGEHRPGDHRPQSLSDLIPHLSRALSDGEVIDLILPGSDIPLEVDGIENTQAVLLDPAQPSATLKRVSAGRQYVLIRNILQQIRDYRAVLRTAGGRRLADRHRTASVSGRTQISPTLALRLEGAAALYAGLADRRNRGVARRRRIPHPSPQGRRRGL
jgi:hypothetical protein